MKHGLKQFKEDLKTKKMLYNYVPVTMDELMTRFLHNIHRNEYLDDLNENRQLLELTDLKSEHDEAISQGVEKSMKALANLINQPAIDTNRQPNQENNLYLKLLAKCTSQHKLEMIRMDSLN